MNLDAGGCPCRVRAAGAPYDSPAAWLWSLARCPGRTAACSCTATRRSSRTSPPRGRGTGNHRVGPGRREGRLLRHDKLHRLGERPHSEVRPARLRGPISANVRDPPPLPLPCPAADLFERLCERPPGVSGERESSAVTGLCVAHKYDARGVGNLDAVTRTVAVARLAPVEVLPIHRSVPPLLA